MADEYGLANLLSGQPLPSASDYASEQPTQTPPPAQGAAPQTPAGYRPVRLPNGGYINVYKTYTDEQALDIFRQQRPDLFEHPQHKAVPKGHAAEVERPDADFEQKLTRSQYGSDTQDIINNVLNAEQNVPSAFGGQQVSLAPPTGPTPQQKLNKKLADSVLNAEPPLPQAFKGAETPEDRARAEKALVRPEPEKQGFWPALQSGVAGAITGHAGFLEKNLEALPYPYDIQGAELAQGIRERVAPIRAFEKNVAKPQSELERVEAWNQPGMAGVTAGLKAEATHAGEVLGGFAGKWGPTMLAAKAGAPGQAISAASTYAMLFDEFAERAKEANIPMTMPQLHAGAALSTALFQAAPAFITKGLPAQMIAPAAKTIAEIYEKEGPAAAKEAIGGMVTNMLKGAGTSFVGASGAMIGTEAAQRAMLGQPNLNLDDIEQMMKDAGIISSVVGPLHGRAATREAESAYKQAATADAIRTRDLYNQGIRVTPDEANRQNQQRRWPEMRTEGEPVPPKEEAPVGEAPVGEAPVGEAPVGEAPAKEEPVGEAPAEKEVEAPAPYYESLGLSKKSNTFKALQQLDINNAEHHPAILETVQTALDNPRLKVKDVDALTALRDQLQPETTHAEQITETGAPDGRGGPQPIVREEGGDQAVSGKGVEPSGQGEQAPEVEAPKEEVEPQNPREAWEALRSEGDPDHKALPREAQIAWKDAFNEGAADKAYFDQLKTTIAPKAERQTGKVEEEVPDTAEEASDKDEFLYSKKKETPWWYSPVARVLKDAKIKKQTGKQWKNWLAGQEGVKPDELEHSGLNDYLDLIGDMPIEKGELQHFTDTNGVKIAETERRDVSLPEEPEERHEALMQDPNYAKLYNTREYVREAIRQGEEELEAMHREYAAENTTPARRNELKAQRYEAVEQLRQGSHLENELTARLNSAEDDIILALPPAARFKQHTFRKGSKDYRELLIQLPQTEGEGVKFVQSTHFNEPNVLTFVRGNTRDNGKTFFVEEVQSDWGQRGQQHGFLEKGEALPRDEKAIKQDIDALRDEREAAYEEWSEAIKAEGDRHEAADTAIRSKIRPDMPTEERLALNERRMEEFQRTRDVKEALHAAYDAKIGPIDARLSELRAERRAALYETQKVPSAPFVGSVEKWTALALKKIIQHAVSTGHERVTFINGRQSAMRWQQRKLASRIVYDAEGTLRAYDPNGDLIYEKPVKEENLASVLSKKAAERLLAQEPELGVRTSTQPTYVGGEGLIRHYDQTIPKVLNKVLNNLLKGSGTKIELERVVQPDVSDFEGQGDTQLSFKITPELRAAVEKGIPLFAKKQPQGAVHTAESLKAELKKLYGKDIPKVEISTREKEGVDEQTQGFFDPKNKRAVLIADNIEKGEDIHGLLRHEVAVHLKKLGATDAEFNDFLRQIEALRAKGAKDVVEAFNNVPKGTKPEDVTHEALAYLVQHARELPIVKRFMSWLRRNTYKLTGNAEWLKGDDFAVMADEVLSGKRIAKETPLTKSESKSIFKGLGDAVGHAIAFAVNPDVASKDYAKFRRMFVAESGGLTKALESLPTYDPSLGIRADYLRNQYDSAFNLTQEGLYTGIPVIEKATGVSRIEPNERLTMDKLMQDTAELPLSKSYDGSEKKPLQVMADIFRIKMGELEHTELREVADKLLALRALPDHIKKSASARAEIAKLRAQLQQPRERRVTQDMVDWANREINSVKGVQDILDRWAEINRSLLDFERDTGWLSPELHDKLAQRSAYIPMFMPIEDILERRGEAPAFPGGGPRATGAWFTKSGRSSLMAVNVWENMAKRYASAVANGMRNNVVQRSATQLEAMGLAERLPYDTKAKEGVVKFRINGKDALYKIKDEDAFRSLSMLQMVNHPALELLAIPTTLTSRTALFFNPEYYYRTTVYEPLAANLVTMARGILGPVTPADAMIQVLKIMSGFSKETKELQRYGVTGTTHIGRGYDRFSEGLAKASKIQRMINGMEKLHAAFDEGTRNIIYKSAQKDAKRQGITDPQVIKDIAMTKARDFADFGARGSLQSMRAATKLVPFLHSHMVGMDKMLRAATGHGQNTPEGRAQRQRFISNALIGASTVVGLTMLYSQDKRYRDLPIKEWARNLIVGFDDEGHAIKIPMPQELGFLVGYLPQQMTRYMAGISDAAEAKKAFHNMAVDTLLPPGMSDPTLMALRGWVQAATNTELYSGLPIESPQELLELPLDRNKRATIIGKEVAKVAEKYGIEDFSPDKFDSVMRTYLTNIYGTTAALAAMYWDYHTGKRGFFDLPFDKDVTERYPWIKAALSNPKNISAVPRFYEMAKPLYETLKSVNALSGAAEGSDEYNRYQRLVADPVVMDRYRMAKVAEKYRTAIHDVEDAISKLDGAKMPEAEKRKLYMDGIKQRNELARKAVEIMTETLLDDKKLWQDIANGNSRHIEVTREDLQKQLQDSIKTFEPGAEQ